MDLFKRWKFHFWYNRFQPPPWDTGIAPPELIEFIGSHPAGRALDLGCGTGTNVITLAKHGWQTTGIDFAWSAIRIARRKAKQEGVKAHLLVEDVSRLRGIEGTFDLILDIGCFHNLSIDSRLAYLGNVDRLLAPTGTYLLYVHIKQNQQESGHGIGDADLDRISATGLLLISKETGVDGNHPSAWLAYRHATPEIR